MILNREYTQNPLHRTRDKRNPGIMEWFVSLSVPNCFLFIFLLKVSAKGSNQGKNYSRITLNMPLQQQSNFHLKKESAYKEIPVSKQANKQASISKILDVF